MEKSLRNSETPDLSPPSGGLLQKKNLALLTLAHTVNDTYTGFLAPLLPIIVPTLGISLTLAGALVTTLSISTSLGQPLAGHLSDRFSKRAPSLFGLLFAGFFLSAIGIAPTYRFLLLLLILGGLGSAFFHPLAAAMTGAASGRRRGLGMAIFVAGGRVGVALGPLIAISIATLLGLKFLPLTAGLGVTMFFLLYRYGPTPRLSPQRHERRGL
ncbi:MAG: MFS transporter, partial [Nitrospinota bacterium]